MSITNCMWKTIIPYYLRGEIKFNIISIIII